MPWAGMTNAHTWCPGSMTGPPDKTCRCLFELHTVLDSPCNCVTIYGIQFQSSETAGLMVINCPVNIAVDILWYLYRQEVQDDSVHMCLWMSSLGAGRQPSAASSDRLKPEISVHVTA